MATAAAAAAANAAEVKSDKPQAGATSLDNDAAAAIAALEVKDQKEHKEQKEHKQGDDAAAGSDSEEDGDEKAADGAAAAEKKKKKKKKKKKAGASAAVGGNACGVHLFCQGGRNPTPAAAGSVPIYNANKAVRHRVQTSPVSVPIADLYKDKIFPEGQILNHPGDFNTFRTGSEEKRAAERLYEGVLAEAREAAEVHRQVRADFQRWVRPGLSMIEIAQYIENGTRAGLKSEGAGLKRGWGFPTGLSLNHVAAHYSPNYKDTTVLKETDVMKVDFGTHINGTIIDCAFTVAFDPKFDPLLEAVREATNAGLNAAGIDVRLCDIGGAIQEVMESYEVEIGGVTHKVKPIQGLCGHSIGPYKIHYGKSVPALRNHDVTKMEEGEFYAIETFGSTGRARVLEDGECSHFMKTWDQPTRPLRTKAAKDLLRHIDTHHGTLAFARRWLDDAGQTGHMGALKELCDAGVVNKHPPLVDIKGSYTAQFEHTFFLRPTCKEILTRGDDY